MKRKTVAQLKFALLVGAFIASLFACTRASAQATQPTTRPARGVWYQPVESFDKWKSRGISDLIGVETNSGAVTPRQFLDAAQAKGLRVWVQHPLIVADPTLARHPAIAGVINAPDEPDGGGNAPPATMQANYAAIKAIAPTLPVLINFDGNRMLGGQTSDATYAEYCKGADVIFMDLYPLNYGHGPGSFGDIATLSKRLKTLSGGTKPLGAFIECSDQRLYEQPWTQSDGGTGTGVTLASKMRGPTAGEMLQEVKVAVVDGGATMIGYFPDVIGAGWVGFDGVTDDVAAAMTQVNATLTVPAAAGAVAASSGAAAPPPAAATKPASTQPAPAPFPITPAIVYVDLKHRRYALTRSDRPKANPGLVTDPADVAELNRIVARNQPK